MGMYVGLLMGMYVGLLKAEQFFIISFCFHSSCVILPVLL